MTLRQLECFAAVLDEGSFTRAAAKLYLSQPGLSHQIKALERAVGCALIDRAGQRSRPTTAGRAMIPHAREALAQARRSVSVVRNVSRGSHGELRVATVYSVSLGLLPHVLRSWSSRFPTVDITVSEHPHSEGLQAHIRNGHADVAIGPRPELWPGPCVDLGIERFVVVRATDAGTAGASKPVEAVELADLGDQRWIHYAASNGLAVLLDAACARAGFRPAAVVHVEQTASALSLAAAGVGLALVPENIVPPHYDGQVLPLRDPVERKLSGYSHSDQDPLCAAFLEVAREHTRALLR